MPNKWFTKGKQTLMKAGFDLSAVGTNIKAALIDTAQLTNQITAITNATPAQVTSTAHGLSTGDTVVIVGVAGATGANGYWTVTLVDANNFTINNGSNPGVWTSGGAIVRLSVDAFLSAIPAGARTALTGNLGSKTVSSQAVFDANDDTFGTIVGGPINRGIIVYRDTGSAATSDLLHWIDTGTNLPVTPNGGTVTVTWNASGIMQL
jgi:predicted aspartyl protease